MPSVGSGRGFRSRRSGTSDRAGVLSTSLVLRERRAGFVSRAAFSSETPDPKSSSATGAGISTSVSSSAALRRDRVAGRLAVLRGVERRRGVCWLVPSESELLVGINGNLTEPCKYKEAEDERSSQTSVKGLFRMNSDSQWRTIARLMSPAECTMPAAKRDRKCHTKNDMCVRIRTRIETMTAIADRAEQILDRQIRIVLPGLPTTFSVKPLIHSRLVHV